MSDAILPLLKPDLYALDSADTATLRGGRCECGHTFFPFQTFGCERCGRSGDALRPFSLAGRGQLRAVATVHVHADERRQAPFVIGTIALDDGPVVRTLLLDSVEHNAIGQRVEAVLVPVATENARALDLRFRIASAP